MLHVNKNYFNSHSLYEKTIVAKKKKKIEKYYMTSVNLGKTLKYLTVQENLRSENLTEYYSGKGIFFAEI